MLETILYLSSLQFFATAANLKLFEDQKESLKAKNLEARAAAQEAQKSLNKAEIVFIKQAADDGRLFGSVSKKEIISKMSELMKASDIKLHEELCESDVLLETPIKNIGVYEVMIALHSDISVSLIAAVARTSNEAKTSISGYKAALDKKADLQNLETSEILEEGNLPESI
jgi:large subunit ribosomal protein L9